MCREQARGFVAVLMLVLPALGMAQSAEEVRLIQVDPGAFNAYGHWLGESGKLELRCSGGRTFADGWQISPTLQLQDLPPASPVSPSPKRTMVLAVCSYRDSLYAAGDPAESVVAACQAKLRNSGLVDLEAVATDGDKVEGGISHDGGPNYRIYWLGNAPGLMKLGGQEPVPTQAMIKAARESEAQATAGQPQGWELAGRCSPALALRLVVVDVGETPARRNGVEILPVEMVMAMLSSGWPSAQSSRLTK